MSCECDSYRLSRRRFMQSTGMAGFATLLGMPVRNLLAAERSPNAAAEHVILLWMSGGMSHIDTFDPKPGRPTGGEFNPIKTSVPGIDISEILPRTAAQMHHAALIRSIAGFEGDHDRARYNLLTGYRIAPQLIHPGVGSVVAHERSQIGDLPSFVSVGGRTLSSGYLGQKCEAYYIGNAGEPDPYVQMPEGITTVRAERRLELLKNLNQRFRGQHPDPYLEAAEDSYTAARTFMDSPALAAFKLDDEPQQVRSAYGANAFGRGCLLARRLVQQGVRFIQVNIGGFDTHEDNFNYMRQRAAVIDPAIGALIADLASTGLLGKTLVMVLSEFGRTPRINDASGRDHHPGVFSTLMAGGGIKPGTLIGSSDADGYLPRDRPVKVGDIHATVCAALGINQNKQVMTPLGRPMKLVEEGTPIKGLL